MKQFVLGCEPDSGGIVRLDGKDYRYLVRVRRLAAGEFFPAVLPNGEEILVKIISVNNGTLTGKCTPSDSSFSAISAPLRLRENSSQEIPPIILFQAIPKADKMDIIVRQAVEGGVSEIVPFVSEFSVSKTGAGGQKFSRWERIVKEARQQSGSVIATALHQSLTFNELLEYWKKQREEGALGILFHHLGLEQESLHGYLYNYPKKVALAVGPEGGFSDKEVYIFRENGLLPLTIGDTVFRTETAALYCAAAIRILLLERNSWELKQK